MLRLSSLTVQLLLTETGMLQVLYRPLKITHPTLPSMGRTDSALQPIAALQRPFLRPRSTSQRPFNWIPVTSPTLFTLYGHAWNWLTASAAPFFPPLSRRSPGLQRGPVCCCWWSKPGNLAARTESDWQSGNAEIDLAPPRSDWEEKRDRERVDARNQLE